MLMHRAGGRASREQWWEGTAALGLEAPLEICSAASGSSAKHFSGQLALGAAPEALPVKCHWAEGLHRGR